MRQLSMMRWPLLLLVLVAALLPAPASAHDDLQTASPGAGDTLGAVPDVLRLTFTRAQNLELASVRLIGPSGEVALGDLRAHPDSSAVVLVPVLGRWSAGGHTVRWRIVGQDGHPVAGEYTFVVEEGARGLAAEEPDSAGTPSAAPPAAAAPADDGAVAGFDVRSPAYVAVRWLGFASLLGVLGAVSWSLLVLPLARRRDGSVDVGAGRKRAATVGVWSAVVLLLAAFGRLWAQIRALGGGDPEAPSLIGSVLTSTAWGAGWWLQLVGALLALVGFAWARRGRDLLPWTMAGVAALGLSFTPALSGHAVAVDGIVSLAVLTDGVHVLAAGGWMGGLLLLLVAGLPAARGPEGSRERLAPLVEGFSLTALGFATLLVLTGVFAAWLHLGAVDALWSSGYGRTLLVKLGLLIPLLGTGAYNWLRVRPALSGGEGGAGRLRLSGGTELAVAVAVLLATAVLVATPPPADMRGADAAGARTPDARTAEQAVTPGDPGKP